MVEKTLTVLVSAYNMQEYLNRGIDSLIDERIIEDIEILIVNDGSKDNTLKIAKEYEQKYPDSIKAIDKPNGGYGSTFNAAIPIASGRYFKNMDADDWYDTEEFVKLVIYLKALEKDIDVIITNFSYEYLNGSKSTAVDFSNITFNNFYNTLSSNISPLKNGSFDGFNIHSITYLSSLLKNHNIRLLENCFYIDMEYLSYPLLYIKSIVFLKLSIYKYFIGREGQSVSRQSLVKNREQHIKVCTALLDFYRNNEQQFEDRLWGRNVFHSMLDKTIRSSYSILFLAQSNKELKMFDQMIMSYHFKNYTYKDDFKMKLWRYLGMPFLVVFSWLKK